jgi:ribosome-associated protein
VEENERLALILEALEAKKPLDVVTLDVGRQTQMMDFLVICTGTSNIHIRALADGVIETMKEHGYKGVRAEGYNEARWVLLDYGDVVVHVQHSEERVFYALERLWKDCPFIPFTDAAAEVHAAERAAGVDG